MQDKADEMSAMEMVQLSGHDFLADALSQAHLELGEAVSEINRLEETVEELEAQIERLAEERHDLLETVHELSEQLTSLGTRSAPVSMPVQTAPVHTAPVVQPIPAQTVPVQNVPTQNARPALPTLPQVAPPPKQRRMSMRVRATLDRVSDWMWDDPPDEADEHAARSLRSRWRAGVAVAVFVAVLCLSGLAVSNGVSSVEDRVQTLQEAVDSSANTNYISRPVEVDQPGLRP
jgi:outer membrane murein-binding lipoprotein Lpp